jgi:membrane-associated phospholipid phosphatase
MLAKLAKRVYLWLWLPALLFAVLALMVVAGWQWPVDGAVPAWLADHHRPLLGGLLTAVSAIGQETVVLVAAALAALLMAARGAKQNATFVVYCVVGAIAGNNLLKLLFRRERPPVNAGSVAEYGFSFPSGHATASCSLILALICLAWPTRWRWWVFGSGLLFVAMVGLSRLYLGAHYPSDILAGWCFSLVWVGLVLLRFRAGRPATL